MSLIAIVLLMLDGSTFVVRSSRYESVLTCCADLLCNLLAVQIDVDDIIAIETDFCVYVVDVTRTE